MAIYDYITKNSVKFDVVNSSGWDYINLYFTEKYIASKLGKLHSEKWISLLQEEIQNRFNVNVQHIYTHLNMLVIVTSKLTNIQLVEIKMNLI